MNFKLITALAAGIALATTAGSFAYAQMGKEKTVQVGGAPMYPSKNIIQNAVNSKDHTTLVAAVKAAGLVETLEVPGRRSSADLMKTAAMGMGKNTLKTVEGETLTVTCKSGAVRLTDSKGGM